MKPIFGSFGQITIFFQFFFNPPKNVLNYDGKIYAFFGFHCFFVDFHRFHDPKKISISRIIAETKINSDRNGSKIGVQLV